MSGEIVRWEPADGNIIAFAVPAAGAENLVSLPARAFDGLTVAPDGGIEGVYVDALMTVCMEFDARFMSKS